MAMELFEFHCKHCQEGPGDICPFDYRSPIAHREQERFLDACLFNKGSGKHTAEEIVSMGLRHCLPVDSSEYSQVFHSILWRGDEKLALEFLKAPNPPSTCSCSLQGVSPLWIAGCLGMLKVLFATSDCQCARSKFCNLQTKQNVLHALSCDDVYLNAFATADGPIRPVLPADHPDRAEAIYQIATVDRSLLEMKDEQGYTPLEHALRHGTIRCALALISAGAQVPCVSRREWLACERAMRAARAVLQGALPSAGGEAGPVGSSDSSTHNSPVLSMNFSSQSAEHGENLDFSHLPTDDLTSGTNGHAEDSNFRPLAFSMSASPSKFQPFGIRHSRRHPQNASNGNNSSVSDNPFAFGVTLPAFLQGLDSSQVWAAANSHRIQMLEAVDDASTLYNTERRRQNLVLAAAEEKKGISRWGVVRIVTLSVVLIVALFVYKFMKERLVAEQQLEVARKKAAAAGIVNVNNQQVGAEASDISREQILGEYAEL